MRAARLDELVGVSRALRGAPALVPVRTHFEDMVRFHRSQELGFQVVDEVSRQCGIPSADLLRTIP